MLISRTPFRLSLYGGGLDYPEWYSRFPANVLCAGLDYYCYQTVRELPPFFSHQYRATYSEIEITNEIDNIKHPSIREVFKKYGNGKKLEVSHIGDLPSRSGIGSSSAFTVGLINCLLALNGRHLGKVDLAKAAIRLEQGEMGEKVGCQDQCAAAFGGLVKIEADSEGIKPQKFISRKDYIDYICKNLLLGFDGKERNSQITSKKIAKNLGSGQYDSLLHELTELSNTGIKAFGDEADIGKHALLTKESRQIKLHLTDETNNERANQLIGATEKAGSLCTRIMGAGGGGFFVCWAPSYKHEQIKSSVSIKTWVDVRLATSGSQVIFSEN